MHKKTPTRPGRVASLLIAACYIALSPGRADNAPSADERLLVRIASPSPERMTALRRMPLDFASAAVGDAAEAVVSPGELDALLAGGYELAVLGRESDLRGFDFAAAYHTYEETVQYLQQVEAAYPHLARRHIIGRSTALGLPIWALKVSDNPDLDEDETAVLIDGMHHAREPIGNEICLAFIDRLLGRYGLDERITGWVDGCEIWVVPILNPEGYKYISDNGLASPWWRKNLRDNNGNGRFDPSTDGVDLNRNYDFNWTRGGSPAPSDWTYRGPQPFSEDETRAKRDLALRERFAAAVSYHSYGELIYYQWSWPDNDELAPDHAVLAGIASDMAARIRKLRTSGTYTIDRQGATNQSSPWIYGTLGTYEFLVEVGTSFIPAPADIQPLVEANLEGLFFFMDRLGGPGLSARILDELTGEPLEAVVILAGVDDTQFVRFRRSDPRTGRYIRFLQPGTYNFIVAAPGHMTRRFRIEIGNSLSETTLTLRPLAP